MATNSNAAKKKNQADGKGQSRTQPKAHQDSFWKNQLPQILALAAIAFVLYGITLRYGYILDDKIVLDENKFVQKGTAGLKDIFGKESFTGYLGEQKDLVAGSRYRPLSIASFAIEHSLFGKNPGISHMLNVLFYALTGIVIYRVLCHFLGMKSGKDAWLSVPFIAAALYLLHPLHTEAVANIKGRDEIFAVLFSFVAIAFSVRQFLGGSVLNGVLAGFFFLLGMLGKENAIMLLPLVPVSFWFFLRAERKDLLPISLPYAVATLLFLMMRTRAIGFFFSSGKEITEIMNNPFYGVSFADKSATIFYTLGLYLKLLVFPHPLTHDYYPYQIPIIHWSDPRAWLSLLAYMVLAGLAVWGWKKREVYSWSVLYFILTLSITSNFVFSVGTFMNERFMFMPSVAFCLVMAWLLVDKLPQWAGAAGKWAGLGIAGVFALGFAFKTFSRVPDWETQEILDLSALKVSKNSARANSYAGYNIYRKALEEKDASKQKAMYDEALPHVNRALEIYPQYGDAVTTKAGIIAGYYQLNGNLDSLLSGFLDMLDHRHVEFIDQYMEYLNRRLAQSPDKEKLIRFYHASGYGIFIQKQKDLKLAEKYLRYGLSLDPSSLQIIEDLSQLFMDTKNYRAGLTIIEEGMKFHPEDSSLQALRSKMKSAGNL